MNVEQIRVLNGPNYWSIYRHNLIVLRLDLEEMDDTPSDKIQGFHERLNQLIPTLYEHRCSENKPGGFLERVGRGTCLAHVIEHVALEIQTLAGMNTGFGRTRSAGKKGLYHVVFSYVDQEAGKYAGLAAINVAKALVNNEAYNLSADIEELKSIWHCNRFGPSTGSIVNEALQRNIPCIRLDDNSLVQLGYGIKQKRIEATIASTTSAIAVELAGDKKATKRILESANVPVPRGGIAYTKEELTEIINDIGYPVVIKPRDGHQGKGATIYINNSAEAFAAFELAKEYSYGIICEKFIEGNDFRALVINYRFVAAAMRKPAAVTGDGKHTIQHLVEEINKDAGRGEGHENVMTRIKMDDGTLNLLFKKGYTPGTILPEGEECFLKSMANLSTGGTATDVTDTVHPKNIALFNRIARVIGLDICGIDIMAKDLSIPLVENGGTVIEVNAAPGFRMHLHPSQGVARNVAAPVLDMLFPDGNATIPIIAISGTNGKTTTTRLIAHMCMQQGLTTGYTTTEGIYIQNDLLEDGDCSGPVSARMVLKDATVEIAVLECARGGILKGGLGFTECDTAIITNIAEDHLGVNGIVTIEELARVKSVVAQSVKAGGYAILNADDDVVYNMRNEVTCKVALFSLNDQNPRVTEHCTNGGLAAVYANTYITIFNGNQRIKVARARNIPLTFNGTASFNIANILGAVLAAYTSNLSLDTIRHSLMSFTSSPEQNPGRMNVFNFHDFTVVIDYAHNPHGMRALGEFVKSAEGTLKIGVIAGVGDRRNEDIVALGEEAGKLFDEVIIRMDDYLRGRTVEEICGLLSTGIYMADPNKKVVCIPDEEEAIRTAVGNAQPGNLIVALTDKVKQAIEITTGLLKEDLDKNSKQLPAVKSFPVLKNVAV